MDLDKDEINPNFQLQTVPGSVPRLKTRKPQKVDTSEASLGLQPYRLNFYSYELAVWTGLEPATLAVTGRYSNQLNYQTKFPNSYEHRQQSIEWKLFLALRLKRGQM